MNALQLIREKMKSDKDYTPKYVKQNSAGKTPRTYGGMKRGAGYTRKSHEQSKVRRLMARASRKINYRFAKRKGR